jgi:hypothetical protein
MPPLPDDLRGQLEKAVTAARDAAEAGALAALKRLFVDNADSRALPPDMSDSQRVKWTPLSRQKSSDPSLHPVWSS